MCQLTEVLYAPEVRYTLVSIGCLNKMRFTSTFGDGKCVICMVDGKCIAQVLKNTKELYCVKHKLNFTNSVTEKISIDQLYC